MRELSIWKSFKKKSVEQPSVFNKRETSSIPKISTLKFRKNFYKVVERFTINANKKDNLDEEAVIREKAHLMEN